VEAGHEIAGCGGWSRRATLYGNDGSSGRDPGVLDPATSLEHVTDDRGGVPVPLIRMARTL